ncbi:MAG: hypothetical protein KatS3mg008_2066 [Acidimicrobiales bacterium]|nr:MAG: hypothetical protein KatS3mg008_2066 [Acidimicrobiales bacterium]
MKAVSTERKTIWQMKDNAITEFVALAAHYLAKEFNAQYASQLRSIDDLVLEPHGVLEALLDDPNAKAMLENIEAAILADFALVVEETTGPDTKLITIPRENDEVFVYDVLAPASTDGTTIAISRLFIALSSEELRRKLFGHVLDEHVGAFLQAVRGSRSELERMAHQLQGRLGDTIWLKDLRAEEVEILLPVLLEQCSQTLGECLKANAAADFLSVYENALLKTDAACDVRDVIRGVLYHEIGHVLWSPFEDKVFFKGRRRWSSVVGYVVQRVKKMLDSSGVKVTDAVLNSVVESMQNLLEDMRIERLLIAKWPFMEAELGRTLRQVVLQQSLGNSNLAIVLQQVFSSEVSEPAVADPPSDDRAGRGDLSKFVLVNLLLLGFARPCIPEEQRRRCHEVIAEALGGEKAERLRSIFVDFAGYLYPDDADRVLDSIAEASALVLELFGRLWPGEALRKGDFERAPATGCPGGGGIADLDGSGRARRSRQLRVTEEDRVGAKASRERAGEELQKAANGGKATERRARRREASEDGERSEAASGDRLRRGVRRAAAAVLSPGLEDGLERTAVEDGQDRPEEGRAPEKWVGFGRSVTPGTMGERFVHTLVPVADQDRLLVGWLLDVFRGAVIPSTARRPARNGVLSVDRYLRGERHPFTVFREEFNGVAVGLLLDTSGSMEDSVAELSRLTWATASALKRLGAHYQVRCFNVDESLVYDSSRPATLHPDAYRKFDACGGTDLTEAACSIARWFAVHAHVDKKLLLILSDGYWHLDREGSKALRKIRGAGTIVVRADMAGDSSTAWSPSSASGSSGREESVDFIFEMRDLNEMPEVLRRCLSGSAAAKEVES